ncbi:ABC transporter ATP-binding protein [Actinoplanes sp. TBRC 11911]|uniref:ABC transporter ATP-binding protein n=1 Tax=Actinoplanes sp. TBRC 11911 TaxID=2729386 RepID=UPI00145F03EF|nr:ABC transporter ATP-binding protein [Actinoplanes sp. TBRC 11911]NMO49725.1 ABC transporter ATP-binding protein [Actinoplanes sp. TBRC 11911]
MSEAIRFDNVRVDYGRTRALADFSLSVGAGETVALLGPSGSGKSTALKALAGFERPSAGRVHLAGRDVTDLPPYERGLGVVVQQYALFPHMRVADNVAFGLKARRTAKAIVKDRVAEVLTMVGMAEFAHRYPAELSGGQQQRVAIARALAPAPEVLLLDEPLSALDAKLRQDMIGELQRLRADLPGIAMLYVTHDQVEALSLADRIVVMRDGRIVDSGPAAGLYRTPPSPFTASFLGDANLVPTVVVETDVVQAGDLTVRLDTGPFTAGDPTLLCLRPHEIEVGPGWTGRLSAVQWRGASYRLAVEVDGVGPIRLDVSSTRALPEVGQQISIAPASGAGVLVPS